MPIYFFQEVGNPAGNIKIGWAKDPQRRLKEIQKMSPALLHIVGVIDGDRWYEAEIHRVFSNFRLWGEWFKAVPALLDFIKNPSLWLLQLPKQKD